MTRNLFSDDYFYWLVDLIDDGRANDHMRVLEKLYATEFYSLVAYDDNRIADGLGLRIKFSESISEHLYFVLDDLPECCTILEMMIALSIRWENDVMYDPSYGDRSHCWFWMMISNLGLSEYPDWMYDDEKVEEILKNLVDRTYDSDGKNGALFWTKMAKNDFRRTEIWSQINEFFVENDIF